MSLIADNARSRGVTRLVHFTPARNLPHILDDGALRPVADLRADRRAWFAATDLERYDAHPEMTCSSIEYPNAYYLRHARSKPSARIYPDWAALLLSVDLLDRSGVLVSTRNAAAGTATATTHASFDALYASVVAGRERYRRGPYHLDAVPTDLQAEVLIPGAIALSQVDGLLFPTAEMCWTIRANLRQVRREPPSHWTWGSSLEAFDPYALRRCVHGGARPEEHDCA